MINLYVMGLVKNPRKVKSFRLKVITAPYTVIAQYRFYSTREETIGLKTLHKLLSNRI